MSGRQEAGRARKWASRNGQSPMGAPTEAGLQADLPTDQAAGGLASLFLPISC